MQELKLEEEQWHLDQKLRYYESKEGECWHVPVWLPVHSGGGAGSGLVAHPTLLQPLAPAESLKTPEDHMAAQETLAQLLEVVRKRDTLILRQEEKRLSELQA